MKCEGWWYGPDRPLCDSAFVISYQIINASVHRKRNGKLCFARTTLLSPPRFVLAPQYAFDSTLGYPGEGPPKRVVRNRWGLPGKPLDYTPFPRPPAAMVNPFAALDIEEPSSCCEAGSSRSSSRSSLRPGSTRSGTRGPSPLVPRPAPPSSPSRAPRPPASSEDVPARSPARLVVSGRISEGHLTTLQCDRERLRKLLQKCRQLERASKHWKRVALKKRAAPAAAAKKASAKAERVRASKTTNPASNAVYVARKARQVIKQFSIFSAADKAAVCDTLMESFDEETRAALRARPVVARERFLAVRWAIGELQEHWWTPANWLELRLKKYLAMRVFTLGHKLFSKRLCKDGVWRRAILMRIPGPLAKARKDGICSDLFVPSPFRSPKSIKAAQDDILKNHHFSVSDVCCFDHVHTLHRHLH